MVPWLVPGALMFPGACHPATISNWTFLFSKVDILTFIWDSGREGWTIAETDSSMGHCYLFRQLITCCWTFFLLFLYWTCFCLLFVLNMIMKETQAYDKVQIPYRYVFFILVDVPHYPWLQWFLACNSKRFMWNCVYTCKHIISLETEVSLLQISTYVFINLLYFYDNILEIFLLLSLLIYIFI